jgi:hypothetical protein
VGFRRRDALEHKAKEATEWMKRIAQKYFINKYCLFKMSGRGQSIWIEIYLVCSTVQYIGLYNLRKQALVRIILKWVLYKVVQI